MTATVPPHPSSTSPLSGRRIPGPGPLASLRGLRASREDLRTTVTELTRHYGEVVALRPPRWLPGVPPQVAYASEPAAVRALLTNPATFVKRSPVWGELATSLGDGLLTSEGETWRTQRRTLQPLFTRRRVARYAEAFVTATEQVAETWKPGTRIDLVREMEQVTLGSVSRALFGTDATDEVAPIVAATDILSRHTVVRGMSLASPPRSWPTPANRRYAALEADLHDRVDALVERARTAREHGTDRDDLITRLRTATDPSSGMKLDEDEIHAQALVLLLAGYDTTSTALMATLFLLGHHPGIQRAVRDEARAVLGSDRPTAEHAGQLALTRRCLDEAMRLYPPAYVTGRTATTDTQLAGWDVPEGTVVGAAISALHRNPRFWPDPERFDPDRFRPERISERDRYTYLPFGGGPRSCIGDHFALLEATLALAYLLNRVEVTTRAAELPMKLGITMRPGRAVIARIDRAA